MIKKSTVSGSRFLINNFLIALAACIETHRFFVEPEVRVSFFVSAGPVTSSLLTRFGAPQARKWAADEPQSSHNLCEQNGPALDGEVGGPFAWRADIRFVGLADCPVAFKFASSSHQPQPKPKCAWF